ACVHKLNNTGTLSNTWIVIKYYKYEISIFIRGEIIINRRLIYITSDTNLVCSVYLSVDKVIIVAVNIDCRNIICSQIEITIELGVSFCQDCTIQSGFITFAIPQ